MSLRDILQDLVEKDSQVLLSDGRGDWEAGALLENLSEPRLKATAHIQPGLYIAAINPQGYLGEVLFKVKQKA